MADAPAWLREAFKDGVDDREMVYRDGVERFRAKGRPYAGANPWCWLAQFDPVKLPCAGQAGKLIERFHFIPRQRVETVLADRLRFALVRDHLGVDLPLEPGEARDLILLAAWDPRNGGLGCEHHHRRLDSHAVSPRAPAIVVPELKLPDHVLEFSRDYPGLEIERERHFPPEHTIATADAP